MKTKNEIKSSSEVIFKIEGEYIELQQILKALNLVSSGGDAKAVITQGQILVNDKIETRRRCKIKKGDHVKFNGVVIKCD